MMMGYFTKVTAAVPSGRVRAVEPPAFYGTKFGDKYKEELLRTQDEDDRHGRAFKEMLQRRKNHVRPVLHALSLQVQIGVFS